ncbi:MAG: 4-(cytidine 5'-diphospho)-2-C-methyl-D-erythritol kinase [Pseudomonadota bacterium]
MSPPVDARSAAEGGRAIDVVRRTRARAKINLTLEVLGRRADGYHALRSVVAFADVADTLTFAPSPDADTLSLRVTGPFAAALHATAETDNLVVQAADAVRCASAFDCAEVPPGRDGGAGAANITASGPIPNAPGPSEPAASRPVLCGSVILDKRLPVAGGIGGGSADAAAMLRLLRDVFEDDADHRQRQARRGLGADAASTPVNAHEKAGSRGNGPAGDAARDALDWMAIARALGADVPVCLLNASALMTGIGERLQPLDHLPAFAAVLVNPGVTLETAPVFKALNAPALPAAAADREDASEALKVRADNAALAHLPTSDDRDAWFAYLKRSPNDLAAPATALAPEIAHALTLLEAAPGCRLARMSGSGPTCFGLFDDENAARAAARALQLEAPSWWVHATRLGAPA